MPVTISREEYDTLIAHGYAGPGRPLAPGAGGFWRVRMDDDGATVLETGLHVEGLSVSYEDRQKRMAHYWPTNGPTFNA